ncbi:hypothetical protein BIGA_1527 [Bifidobacterium pullorum subsp. gallinarum]|uniref:Uncharacterized protein n=2 Tax=Bifidobacterium pullorum TaxID=78448 RepID=A0A087AM59_9BIFI|nr:hypothetical protein BIGA_1527 [Bifidobacterium pullorum subsp. gallinarum]
MYDTIAPNADKPLWCKSSLRSTASEKGMYVRQGPDDELDDSLERKLDKEVENPAASVVERMNNRMRQPSAEEERILKNLVVAQRVRTPGARRRAFVAAQDCLINGIPELTNRFIDIVEQTGTVPEPSGEAPNVPGLTIEPVPEGIRCGITLGSELFQYSVERGLTSEFREVFDSSHWRLGILPEDAADLPLGDEPVITSISFDREGNAERGSFLAMPLGPRRLFYTFIGFTKKEMRKTATSPAFYAGVRQMIVKQAIRRIYSRTEDPDIPESRPRKIDRQSFGEKV